MLCKNLEKSRIKPVTFSREFFLKQIEEYNQEKLAQLRLVGENGC